MELRVKRAPRIDTEITVPGDKSISHRAVIIAALSNGVCKLEGFLPSEDCMRTVNALRALGMGAAAASVPGAGAGGAFGLNGCCWGGYCCCCDAGAGYLAA